MTRTARMRPRAQRGKRCLFRPLVGVLVVLAPTATSDAQADETRHIAVVSSSMRTASAVDHTSKSLHALTKLRFTMTPEQLQPVEPRSTSRTLQRGEGNATPEIPSLHQAETRPDDKKLAEPRETSFGDPGTWRLFVHLGAASDIKSIDNALVNTGVGFTYFPAKNFSFTTEINGLFTSEQGETAAAANINLLMRFHFIAKESWSVYFDAGAGVMLASAEVPRMGSNFNFTPQIGVGASLDIGNDTRLMGGLRWHHISNANTHRDNPGRDSFLLYLGISVPLR